MVYIMVAMILVPSIIGLLLGMLRGSRRAMLRLILVILCLVAAFFLRGIATNMVMKLEFSGQPLDQFIMSHIPAEYAALGDKLMPIITLIVMAVVFLLLFSALEFVSWVIIYPICKIFVKKARKKADGTYGNKHKFIGGVIGLVQGAAVALVMCVLLNGLLYNAGNVIDAVNSLQDDSQGDTSQAMVLADDNQDSDEDKSGKDPTVVNVDMIKQITDYKASKVCSMINNAGGTKAFDFVVTAKTEDGKKITLTGQLDAISGMVKMAKELLAIQNMQMTGGLTGDVATDITKIFNALDQICNNLSDESKDTMNDIVETVVDNMLPDMPLDLTALNFKTVNFANEGQVIAQLSTYKETDFTSLNEEQTKEKATEIVQTVMASDVILPLLSANDEFTIGLSEQHQSFAEEVINDLASKPDIDKNKIDMLKAFFGLNDNA